MDCSDTQLLLNQLVDIGERKFGAGIFRLSSGTNFVPECSANRVSVVSVGDDDRTGTYGSANRLDSAFVYNSFNAVDDTFSVDD